MLEAIRAQLHSKTVEIERLQLQLAHLRRLKCDAPPRSSMSRLCHWSCVWENCKPRGGVGTTGTTRSGSHSREAGTPPAAAPFARESVVHLEVTLQLYRQLLEAGVDAEREVFDDAAHGEMPHATGFDSALHNFVDRPPDSDGQSRASSEW